MPLQLQNPFFGNRKLKMTMSWLPRSRQTSLNRVAASPGLS